MIIAIILLIAVLLIVIWGISTVNGFKKKEIRVQEGLSGVEVALSKRYDMLTKMLDTAKGYMAHETGLFEKVIALRRGMSVAELNDAQQQMDALSGRLFAVAEGYPELRSSEVFVELQRGIGPEHGEKMIERRGVDKIFKGNLLAAVRVGEFTLSIHTGKRTAKANLR